MKYTFGTSEAAARRLESIAGFFNPRAMTFIAGHVRAPVASGLDLGCGPGFTTDMLSRVLPGAAVYGLDSSDAFLRMARTRFPHGTFLRHDVTRTPFPVRGQILYVRFLLSHLPDAVGLVNRWVDELAPDGMLFIEETEAIDTTIGVFHRYLQINTELIRAQGAVLFIGGTLARGNYSAEVVCNEPVRWPAENALAADWFYPNAVGIWEREPFVLGHLSPDERKSIAEALHAIRDSGNSDQDIVWTMRRLVLRKR
jgi:SAM-dependent methyltransferase